MKKITLFATALSLALCTQAQSKLSPMARYCLEMYGINDSISKNKTAHANVNQVINTLELSSARNHQYPTAKCILTVNDLSMVDSLSSLGLKVCTNIGEIVTVEIPLNEISNVSRLGFIDRVDISKKIKLYNNIGRQLTNADNVHSGTGLEQAYTGNGVLLGIVDSGIQYDHINFKDDDGQSRIVEALCNGVAYSTPEEIASLTTDSRSLAHGTHTAGIAGGSYSLNGLQGMAPGADLYLCGLANLYESDIIESIDKIFDYAETHDMPAVVNLSLGSDLGPHDGSSTICRAYEQLAGEGRILVVAAGNSGDLDFHAHGTLGEESEEEPQLKTIVESSYGSTYSDYIGIYNQNDKPLKLRVTVIDDNNNTLARSELIDFGSDFDYYAQWALSESENATEFSRYFSFGGFSGDLYVYPDISNNKYNLMISAQISSASIFSHYRLGLELYGTQGDEIHMWSNGYSSFSNGGDRQFIDGDTEIAMSDDCTGNGTISVGAYASNGGPFRYLNGTASAVQNFTQGDIAYFSGSGIDLNGISRPDVTAPGYMVVSSMNSYYSTSSSEMTAKVNDGGKTYYWGPMAGTSMATPAVSGIIALWLEADPTLDCERIKEILHDTSIRDEYVESNPVKFGTGRIDAYAGLMHILTNGVGDISVDQNRVLVFPNPNNGAFKVFAQGERQIMLTITDTSGAIVHNSTLSCDNGAVDVDLQGSIAPGIYIVNVKGEKLNSSTKMVIK